jgi:hypothetical protein
MFRALPGKPCPKDTGKVISRNPIFNLLDIDAGLIFYCFFPILKADGYDPLKIAG